MKHLDRGTIKEMGFLKPRIVFPVHLRTSANEPTTDRSVFTLPLTTMNS